MFFVAKATFVGAENRKNQDCLLFSFCIKSQTDMRGWPGSDRAPRETTRLDVENLCHQGCGAWGIFESVRRPGALPPNPQNRQESQVGVPGIAPVTKEYHIILGYHRLRLRGTPPLSEP